MSTPLAQSVRGFLRFGMVGATGVFVDMGMLFLLADNRMLNWGISISKTLAAETAIINNFIWNDLWTFRAASANAAGWKARSSRFAKFNLICLAGIGLSVLLLNAQVHLLSVNVYAANLIAIFLVSIWNFGMSAKFGWSRT